MAARYVISPYENQNRPAQMMPGVFLCGLVWRSGLRAAVHPFGYGAGMPSDKTFGQLNGGRKCARIDMSVNRRAAQAGNFLYIFLT